MTPILFKCPSCQGALKVSNPALAGKKIKCPKCGAVAPVPAGNGAGPPKTAPTKPPAAAAKKPAPPAPKSAAVKPPAKPKPPPAPAEDAVDLGAIDEPEESSPAPKAAPTKPVPKGKAPVPFEDEEDILSTLGDPDAAEEEAPVRPAPKKPVAKAKAPPPPPADEEDAAAALLGDEEEAPAPPPRKPVAAVKKPPVKAAPPPPPRKVAPVRDDEDEEDEDERHAPGKPPARPAGKKQGLDVIGLVVMLALLGYLGAVVAAAVGLLDEPLSAGLPEVAAKKSTVKIEGPVVGPEGPGPEEKKDTGPDKKGNGGEAKKGPPAGSFDREKARLAALEQEKDVIAALRELPPDKERGAALALIKAPKEKVGPFAFSPDGKGLAGVTSEDKNIHLWDLRTGKPKWSVPGHEKEITALAFSPDGKILASLSAEEQMIHLRDVEKGAVAKPMKGADMFARSLEIAPDGTVLGGSNISGFSVWDANTGFRKQVPLAPLEEGLPVPSTWAAFAHGGKAVVRAGLKVTDLASGKTLKAIPLEFEAQAAAVSPDGKTLALAGSKDKAAEQTVLLVNLESGAMLPLIAVNEPLKSLAFSPDGKLLFAGSTQFDNHILRVWDVGAGKESLRTLNRDNANPGGLVAVSPGGSLVATSHGNDGTIRLWATADLLKAAGGKGKE